MAALVLLTVAGRAASAPFEVGGQPTSNRLTVTGQAGGYALVDGSLGYDADGTPYFTGTAGNLAADSDGTPYVASTSTVIAVDTDGVYYLAA